MHSTKCPDLDTAGQNLMLNSSGEAEALRLRIAALNYLAESARMRRACEDAEIRANGLLADLERVQRENNTLRMMLGLSYRDHGPLPTPYPDSEIAQLLAVWCKVDQAGAPPPQPIQIAPRRAKPLDLTGARNFGGIVR